MTTKTSKKTQATAEAGQEAIKSFFSTGAEAYETLFADTKARFDKASGGTDEIAEFSNQNMQAWVTAGNTLAKGMETLSADWLAFTKQLAEDNVAAAKSLFAATTVNEVADLQGAYAKDAMDAMQSQGARSGEIVAKFAKEAAEPINARAAQVVEKLSDVAA